MNYSLYSTMTRSKDTLQPINDGEVSFYTCGLTVYSQPHIGNWVGYIYWDVLQRALELDGVSVRRVQNITDVGHLVSDDDDGEDKMEKGAKAEGKTAWEVADKYIAIADHEGYELLGLKKPTLIRATDKIAEQIDFVQRLEEKGYTYEIPGEGIYFDTSKLDDYGKLARLDIEGLEAGARVSSAGKRNPTDFAVWKFSPTDATRDMEWDSPWGKGFPGWHLECSVIARESLGDQIDIHAGGVDHIPIHHTNEIAQTESVTGKPFANTWLHNNHLKVDGGKMAKSIGNIYTLKDILDEGYDIDAFKLLILSKHYQTEGNFTWDILESAQNRLNGYRTMADMRYQTWPDATLLEENYFTDKQTAIHQALLDDINTPEALKILSGLEGDIMRFGLHPTHKQTFTSFLEWIDAALGLNLATTTDITPEQKQMLEQRSQARTDKDWATSDAIRDTLAEQGIAAVDSTTGQIWTRVHK